MVVKIGKLNKKILLLHLVVNFFLKIVCFIREKGENTNEGEIQCPSKWRK